MQTRSEVSQPGIRVESLGKRYRIRAAGERRARMGGLRPRGRETIWALRDVSFDVPRGTILGVIGRNGAGKTTLLSMLSRVTAPTEGRAVLAGKVSALLEVGTGFHPELTGRENVYLNGAVLGMRRREIERKFDEIVAFSEIARFIDTPVKRYSSGMALRLAFSVAAHLDPDILLVDEVLAVGDASFQAKCLGKMGEVTGEGRTVVLVSHNMPTIASLADRCIWLDHGRIVAEGPTAEVIERYLASVRDVSEGGSAQLDDRPRRPEHAGRCDVTFRRVRLLDDAGEERGVFFERNPIRIEVTLEAHRAVEWFEIRAYVKTIEGVWLFAVNSGKRKLAINKGVHVWEAQLDPNYLRPGAYCIDLGMQSVVPQDGVEDAIRFRVEHSSNGYDDPAWRGLMGLLRFDYAWSPVPGTTDVAASEPGAS